MKDGGRTPRRVFLSPDSLDCIIRQVFVRSCRRWWERLSKDASWTKPLWRRNTNVMRHVPTQSPRLVYACPRSLWMARISSVLYSRTPNLHSYARSKTERDCHSFGLPLPSGSLVPSFRHCSACRKLEALKLKLVRSKVSPTVA
jgi:hypothetical protein